MKTKTYILLLLVICSGCMPGSAEIKSYSLDGVRVIYNNFEAIKLNCGPNARACYLPKQKIILCTEWDYIACGHELHHVTHGDFHHPSAKVRK